MESRRCISGVNVQRSDREGCPSAINLEVRRERFKAKDLIRGFTARRHAIPPDERTAALYLHTRRLLEAGTRKRDQLIGQIFQVGVRCDVHAHALRSPTIGRSAAIHARGAGGGDLRLRPRPDVHLPGKRIGIENSARKVVYVRERLSGRSAKAAHHAPGRLLLLDAKNGRACVVRFKSQMEIGRLPPSLNS